MSSRPPIHETAILHALNRGILKRDIFFNDSTDWWRFLEILRYKNHDAKIRYWHEHIQSVADGHRMPWPDDWGQQDPLVRVGGYILMNNHYHVILQEIRTDGIARFMKKLSNSYTGYVQNKHGWEERLFTSTYKSKRVLSDNQLRKLFVYVLVKNAFERYDGGIPSAVENFDHAFRWARQYTFSSLAEAMGDRKALITNNSLFNNHFSSPQEFKKFAKHQMQRYQAFRREIDDIALE